MAKNKMYTNKILSTSAFDFDCFTTACKQISRGIFILSPKKEKNIYQG